MILDRKAIERSVPHAGAMCLLDAVQHWDAAGIACTAAAPDTSHPLARDGVVPAVAAIEYAAQATAVHGTLLEGRPAPVGMLVKLSHVEFQARRIAAANGPLTVHVTLRARDVFGCLYDFEVNGANHPIARGQLMVAFTSAWR